LSTEPTASPLQYGAAPEPTAGGAYDFSGGGLGGGRGFADTSEGPVFDLGVSPDDDQPQTARRPVFELSDDTDLSAYSAIPGAQASPGYPPSGAVPAPVAGASDDETRRAQVAEAILPLLSEL